MPEETAPETYDGEDRRAATSQSTLIQTAVDIQVAMAKLGEKFDNVDVFANETRAIASDAKAAATTADKTTKDVQQTNNKLKIIVLVLVLAVFGVGYNSVRAQLANTKADRIQEYQVANCETSNVTRADAKALWDSVTALIAGLDNSPGNKKFVAELQAKVDKTYGIQRDCTKVDDGKVK